MIKKCVGCGVSLQNKDKDIVGFVPSLNGKTKYCERCFRLIHYNEVSIIDVLKDEEYVINEVSNNAKLVFFIIDFLNINSEVIKKFKSLACEKILIVNKVDLIPNSIKEEKIKIWLKEEYKVTEDIIFTSAKKGNNIGCIINEVEKRKVNHIYLVGFTNSGKSTLLNSLCKKYEVVDKMITTSPIVNTTLDLINIKLCDSLTVTDTPGFTYQETFYKKDELDLIKRLNPKNYLKPITYQLKPESSVVLENRVRIENQSKEIISFTLYLSNDLNIRVIFKNNNILNDLSYRIIEINENQDLVIKGVGFINIKQKCSLGIYTNEFDVYEKRNSLF